MSTVLVKKPAVMKPWQLLRIVKFVVVSLILKSSPPPVWGVVLEVAM